MQKTISDVGNYILVSKKITLTHIGIDEILDNLIFQKLSYGGTGREGELYLEDDE